MSHSFKNSQCSRVATKNIPSLRYVIIPMSRSFKNSLCSCVAIKNIPSLPSYYVIISLPSYYVIISMSRSFKNSLCSRIATKNIPSLPSYYVIISMSRSFKDSLHVNSEKYSYLIITQLLYQRLVLIYNSLCSHQYQ